MTSENAAGRGRWCRRLVAERGRMVPKGRRHATSDVWSIGRSHSPGHVYLSFAERGGNPAAPSRSHWATPCRRCRSRRLRAGRRQRSRGSCGATPPPAAAAMQDYRATTAQWHAERAARRPKQAEIARAQCGIAKPMWPGGTTGWHRRRSKLGFLFAGPAVSWKGRRHGPRQRPGGGQTPGVRSRFPAACWLTFRTMRTMRISHGSHLSSAIRSRSRRVAPRS